MNGGAGGGCLGDRVSLLLDGQLSAAEAEAAWAHVAGCSICRDDVAREGWLKTRLAGCATTGPAPTSDFRGLLVNGPVVTGRTGMVTPSRVAYLGGGAVGLVLAGVVALVVAPSTVTNEMRPPVSSLRTGVIGTGATSLGLVSGTVVGTRSGTADRTQSGTQRVSAGVGGATLVP